MCTEHYSQRSRFDSHSRPGCVTVELFKTKRTPILLYGLDACPVSPRQLRSLDHVVVSCGRKTVNVNTSKIAAECLRMFEVSDVAEAVATRRDRFVTRNVSQCPT